MELDALQHHVRAVTGFLPKGRKGVRQNPEFSPKAVRVGRQAGPLREP